MRAFIAVVLAVCLPGLGGRTAAQPREAVSVERLDPAVDALIPKQATPELVKGDYFGFLEGPVWVREGGYLLFSDVAANRIYKWTPRSGRDATRDRELTTYLDNSGFTGADTSKVGLEVNNGRLHVIALGSNGITLDRDGRVVFAAHGDRAVKRLEKDGAITILADRYEGKRLSGPNDLVYRSDGILYFSDLYGGVRGGASSPYRELPYFGLFMLNGGTVTLLDKDPLGGGPNGVAFSPDERYLYVGNAAGVTIIRYETRPDGTLANRRALITMNPDKGPGGADGIKVDRKGNIYAAGPGGVWIVSPDGRHLGTIRIPHAANIAFGDSDARTLYITAQRDLYRMRVTVAGTPPGPAARPQR